MQKVVSNLRRIAFDHECNISKISRKTGISRTTLTALYKNEGVAVSFKVIEKLCVFFGCGVGDLLMLVECDEDKTA